MDHRVRLLRMLVPLIASAATGMLWAWCLSGFGAHGVVRLVLLLGAVIGAMQGICIRPFKHSDPGEKAIVITAGLFGTAFVFLGVVSLVQALSPGFFLRHGLLDIPSVIIGLLVGTLITTSMAVPVLWPVAAINHALIWWLQVDHVEPASA